MSLLTAGHDCFVSELISAVDESHSIIALNRNFRVPELRTFCKSCPFLKLCCSVGNGLSYVVQVRVVVFIRKRLVSVSKVKYLNLCRFLYDRY